ncbi:MAG: hypothetical protein D6758_11280 [Gammaproteobacteria bacterium]|nr:MAG: hypothetical protein D6758_11280 [Gammaproteobacteria bacterium]
MIRNILITALALLLTSPALALEGLGDQAFSDARASGLMLDQLQTHLPRLEQQALQDNTPEHRLQARPVMAPDTLMLRGSQGPGYAQTQARSDTPEVSTHAIAPERVEVDLSQTIHQIEARNLRHTPEATVDRGSIIGTGIRIQGSQAITYSP